MPKMPSKEDELYHTFAKSDPAFSKVCEIAVGLYGKATRSSVTTPVCPPACVTEV